MARNGEEQAASTAFSNTTSSVFYCSTHGPGVAFDLHDTTSPWIFAAFATITAPIAFLLNTLTILAVKQKMELRQRLSYILLSSMAFSDLLIGGIDVPLSALVALLLPYRIVAVQLFCLMDLVPSMLMFGLSFCSLIHLTMIAWERYIAIRKWSDYKSIVTRSRLKRMVILAWGTVLVGEFCLFVVMPIAVGKDKTALALAVTILVTGSACVLACILVLIVAFYIMIYLGVRKRKLNQILQVNVLIQAKLQNRIAMTTALVTIALILSFVPGVIVGIPRRVYPVLRTRFAWRISDSFLYLNSLVNPLIYCYRDPRFKKAVLEMLRIRKPTVVTTEEVRCVKQNNLLGPEYVGTEKANNPVRLARSQSCNLALFSLDRAHLRSLSTSLKRPMSAPSLPKIVVLRMQRYKKVKTDWPICLPRTASCDLACDLM